MTLLQALRHFIAEALSNMRRNWQVSALAVVVTAVSLFLGGLLYLLGSNLAGALEAWQAHAKLVVYMEVGASESEVDAVAAAVSAFEGVEAWTLVTPDEAQRRLERRLPELQELVAGLDDTPLPASFELTIARRSRRGARIDDWIGQIRTQPGVSGVDDDRQWIQQISSTSAVLRVAALVIGGLLTAGSVFIIASVIRLAALLHREEIKVLRLVGATEFFVRGPFVVGGILQGLFGGIVAALVLLAAYVLLRGREQASLLDRLLLSSFLGPVELVLLVSVGVGAGLLGGLLSVRRSAVGPW